VPRVVSEIVEETKSARVAMDLEDNALASAISGRLGVAGVELLAAPFRKEGCGGAATRALWWISPPMAPPASSRHCLERISGSCESPTLWRRCWKQGRL